MSDMEFVCLDCNAIVGHNLESKTRHMTATSHTQVVDVSYRPFSSIYHLKMSQREMADALNVDPGRISKTIKKLVGLKLIERGKAQGVFFINPFLCWKGNDFDRAKAMKVASRKGMDIDDRNLLGPDLERREESA